MKKFKPGDKVTYISNLDSYNEAGIVKSLHPNDSKRVFVVYKCGGNWSDYGNYTAALTDVVSLVKGWTTPPNVKNP